VSSTLGLSFLKLNCSKACSTARTKCPKDSGNICTTVTPVSRNLTGRTVHLARTRDSFGTRSCGNGTTVRHKKDERPQRARRVRHRWISNRIVVGTSCRPSRHTYREIRREKEKVAHGERACGTERKFTCNEKERYELMERAETRKWILTFQITFFFRISMRASNL
jgi:hypothetical protein